MAANNNFVFGETAPFASSYTLGKQLGQPGQFGVAHLCTHTASNETRAVKIISKARMVGQHRQYYLTAMQNEIDILQRLSNIGAPHIIKFYEYFEDASNLYLVLEMCGGGELFDHIQAIGHYSENDAKKIILQMLKSVKTIHDLDIVHADIKPDNYLFDSKDANAKLKMIDFGHSQRLKPRQYLKSIAGTAFYMAPELICHRYNKACDVWSVGVVMFVILFGYPPFYGDTDEKIMEKIAAGFSPKVAAGFGSHFPASIPVSKEAQNLIAKMLQTNVADRCTVDEALEFPWLHTVTDLPPLPPSVTDALKSFSLGNKFKQAIVNYMSTQLSDDVKIQLKENFKKLDKNGDGTITVDELKEVILSDPTLGHNAAELLKTVDVNGDGSISYKEFLSCATQKRLDSKIERLWQAFLMFDLNRDGKISEAELKTVLKESGNAEIQEFLKITDANKDGLIDFEEFLTMWYDKNNSV